MTNAGWCANCGVYWRTDHQSVLEWLIVHRCFWLRQAQELTSTRENPAYLAPSAEKRGKVLTQTNG